MDSATSKRIATELAETLVGTTSFRLSQITGKGRANQVWLLNTEADRLILRFGEGASATYEKEIWCSEAARNAGVPCAEIRAWGERETLSWMVQEYLEGVDGMDWQGDPVFLWRRIGEHAALINSVPVNGYGSQFKGGGAFASGWTDMLDSWLGWLDKTMLDSDTLDRAQARCMLEMARRLYDAGSEARLIHGDLSPKNVIVSHDKHVSVIDFGNAEGGCAPLWELMHTCAQERDPAAIQAFCEGYGMTEAQRKKLAPDLMVATLLRTLAQAGCAYAFGQHDFETLQAEGRAKFRQVAADMSAIASPRITLPHSPALG